MFADVARACRYGIWCFSDDDRKAYAYRDLDVDIDRLMGQGRWGW